MNFLKQNIYTNNTNNNNTNNNNNNNDNINSIVFMNIDVKQNMCQGIHIDRKGIVLKCINKGKYLKKHTFVVCERHKDQNFDN